MLSGVCVLVFLVLVCVEESGVLIDVVDVVVVAVMAEVESVARFFRGRYSVTAGGVFGVGRSGVGRSTVVP